MARKQTQNYEMVFLTPEQREQAYENYKPLVAFALRKVDNEDDAKDIVVAKLRHLFENGYKPHTEDTRLDIRKHLFVSVRNACFDRLQKKVKTDKMMAELQKADPAEEALFEKEMMDALLMTAIHLFIKGLSPRSKDLLNKRFEEGKTRKKIAEELDILMSEVNREERKLLNQLRNYLREKGLLQ
jgi:RNA polymerase sigma factor (sigma-70 family)